MTKEITITITNNTFKNIGNIKGRLSWRGALALLILVTDTTTFKKAIKDKGPYSSHIDNKNSGSQTLKIPIVTLYNDLSKLKYGKSIGVVIDTLIELYDKKKFEEYKKIKLAGL